MSGFCLGQKGATTKLNLSVKEMPDNAACSNPHTVLRKGSNQAAVMRIPEWVKHGGAEWDTEELIQRASQTVQSFVCLCPCLTSHGFKLVSVDIFVHKKLKYELFCLEF